MSFMQLEDTKNVLEAAQKNGRWESTYLLLSHVESILNNLKLTPLERLSSDGSHNYALLVKADDGSTLVLKLISQGSSLETECLREWQQHPTITNRTAKLINYGELPNNSKWNLQEFLSSTVEEPVNTANVGFGKKNQDYENRGVALLEEALLLSKEIRTNDFNKYVFPDELEILNIVIEREFETKNKEMSRLSNTLVHSKPYFNEDRLWLVHGDYHVGNLTQTSEGLKAFDPFGVRGTKASDAAKYIALSCRDENILEHAKKAESITECNRFDLGWLIAANILKRLHYLKIMGRPSTNEKGNVALAYKAMEIW